MDKQEHIPEKGQNEPRPKDQKPLSDTIKNAHASGDGSMGRSLDSTIESGDEQTGRTEEGCRKGPEQY
jgi:hypothetical protein